MQPEFELHTILPLIKTFSAAYKIKIFTVGIYNSIKKCFYLNFEISGLNGVWDIVIQVHPPCHLVAFFQQTQNLLHIHDS
jgi:hypothetical protein